MATGSRSVSRKIGRRMFDPDTLSETLELLSDGNLARKRAKQLGPFRGVRGVPQREVVNLLVATWKSDRPRLPEDADALYDFFMAAHEDGLVAIGLVAALLPTDPTEALDFADRVMAHVDDVETADALGWLVLGPGLLAAGEPFATSLLELRSAQRPEQRRIALMATLAGLPLPIEGAAAAALRERTGQRRTAFVTEPLTDLVLPVWEAFVRDSAAPVQKALHRVLRSWAVLDPDPVERFVVDFRGGVPKSLRAEVTKAARKGRRLQQQAALAEAHSQEKPAEDTFDPDPWG